MEIKAYIEGFLRKWWLFALILALSFLVGRIVAQKQTSLYTTSTSILLNGTLVASTAIPSTVVQLGTPKSYEAQVVSPAVLDQILKNYPDLTYLHLKQDIVVTSADQILLISVTDISAKRAADIANFLAQSFVRGQSAALNRQLDNYNKSLSQNIQQLNNQIAKLSLEMESGTLPSLESYYAAQQSLVNDEQNLVNYKQALTDIKKAQPFFKKAYIILQPAIVPAAPSVAALSSLRIELIAVGIGMLVAIVLVILIEYFTPFVRHRGELQRVVGFSILAELPNMPHFEQKRLLRLHPPLLRWRLKPLRLLSAAIVAPSVRGKRQVVLVTSPQHKRDFAAVLATLLAHNGHQTLLIDANFENPRLHEQLKLCDPCDIITNKGLQLSFLSKSIHPHLFVLPATAKLNENEHLTGNSLMTLLPELQAIFRIIIIDAPPLDRADTHLLATKASQTLLLVKKRRESLKTLKLTYAICQQLQLHTRCLFLR